MNMTTGWIWIAFAALLALAGARRFLIRRERELGASTRIDDAAVERILRHGTLEAADDEPLDEDEIARAEAEFWEESWDEPDEYGR